MIEFLNQQGINIFELSTDRERFAGFFLNGAYSYNDKYVFNGTIRYDGSNRLGSSPSARWLPTWSFGGSWNLDEEPFLADVAMVDELEAKRTWPR